jgi:magnesium chelatase family protein
METRSVTLSRALGTVTFPAAFSLVAAANPCPCGFRGHPRRPCGCGDEAIRRYLARMSGPLLDRIDMHVELAPVATDEIVGNVPGEASAAVRARVAAARSLQQGRYAGTDRRCNADLMGEEVRSSAMASAEAQSLLRHWMDALALSGRAHARILKVARTIADLEGSRRVERPHVAEAVQYRGVERDAAEQGTGAGLLAVAGGRT